MRFQTSTRRLAVLLFAAIAAGCGAGGEDDEAAPMAPNLPLGVAVAVTGSSFSVRVGSTTVVPVTITRQGGYVGSVDLTVSGLPTGVRADSPRLFGAATTANITITATVNASPTAAASYSVTGQATAITITPRPISLTVLP